MRGRMVIRRGEEPGAYLCDFIANERCPDTDSPVIDTHVEQRCIAGRDGADLVILSEIVEQDQALPYWPDNFRLTIHSSREMRGELRSADVAPVVFRRTPAPMS